MSKPKKTKAISELTRHQVLDAAWHLIAQDGRADVGLSDIARAAGVSRQTVFYAFGNRAGVLTAMVRHKDAQTGHVERLRSHMMAEDPTLETLLAAVGAWLDYLPHIYPVGILLDAASLTDAEAAEAWNDRMVGALRGGFEVLCARLHASGAYAGTPKELAGEVWAQVHPTMWRRLVVECGWSKRKFRESRLRLISGLFAEAVPTPPSAARAPRAKSPARKTRGSTRPAKK